ncbi:MAG TPA: hypothetical protein VKA83_25840 [Methylomirabilota bacterium]|nr:hypothetical protein [Methylomirabilota bacterium]
MMRQRRDPLARVTFVPVRFKPGDVGGQCVWCGNRDPRDQRPHALADTGPRAPCYRIREEHDGGRAAILTGEFDSWTCAESYHDRRIGR